MTEQRQVELIECTPSRTHDWIMINWIDSLQAILGKEIMLIQQDQFLRYDTANGAKIKIFSKKLCQFRVNRIWGTRDLSKNIWF